MEIWVSFDFGKFTVTPDPATVKAGTPLIWRFRSNLAVQDRVRWTVYFYHGSPFRFEPKEISTTTQSAAGQHAGATGTMVPDDPGDYKYGVRAEDAFKQNILGDDDPRLIVTL